jgi:hypothetical protein
MSNYPGYLCEKHGAVVGYTPFEYREPGTYTYSFGPFCPLCISEWYQQTFATLKPINEKPDAAE